MVGWFYCSAKRIREEDSHCAHMPLSYVLAHMRVRVCVCVWICLCKRASGLPVYIIRKQTEQVNHTSSVCVCAFVLYCCSATHSEQIFGQFNSFNEFWLIQPEPHLPTQKSPSRCQGDFAFAIQLTNGNLYCLWATSRTQKAAHIQHMCVVRARTLARIQSPYATKLFVSTYVLFLFRFSWNCSLSGDECVPVISCIRYVCLSHVLAHIV